jgi:uncharacterized protein YbjQ (UPF0145 family)
MFLFFLMHNSGLKLNAEAIVNIRLATSMVMQSASEILTYGTAVKLNPH